MTTIPTATNQQISALAYAKRQHQPASHLDWLSSQSAGWWRAHSSATSPMTLWACSSGHKLFKILIHSTLLNNNVLRYQFRIINFISLTLASSWLSESNTVMPCCTSPPSSRKTSGASNFRFRSRLSTNEKLFLLPFIFDCLHLHHHHHRYLRRDCRLHQVTSNLRSRPLRS